MNHRVLFALLLLQPSCKTEESGPNSTSPDPISTLGPIEHLVRASLATRGVRPTIEELERIAADSSALEDVVDGYIESEEFLLTIADMHSEHLLTRTETNRLPSLGPLEGVNQRDVYQTLAEGPLELVKHVVENNRPYTEFLTADYMMGNQLGSVMFGYDLTDGDDWQPVTWDATRETAGVLSDPGLWLRYPSNGANYHRQRAEFIADTLLCSSFLTRDISISGGIDLSDDEAVANAVSTQTECVGCHQALDPLAANLWGVREVSSNRVRRAYDASCEGDDQYNCYPVATYNPNNENGWESRGLRPPGYYGTHTTGLRTLAESIAQDPRFHQCTARRFYSYLAQVERDDIPLEVIVNLTKTFEDSGWDTKELVKAIVLSDEFAAASDEVAAGNAHLASLQVLRTTQLNRSVAALTGFEWNAKVDRSNCSEKNECWGDQNLLQSDGFGFRLMAGGVEGYAVTKPTHTSTPVRSMILEAFAVEAAAYAVDQALLNNDSRLFTIVNDGTDDETLIRQQLAEFHQRFWGEMVDEASPEVDTSFTLFTTLLSNTNNPRTTWILTLSAFMQDTKFLYY